MRVHFTDLGWEDYLYWWRHDAKALEKLNELIEEIRRTPFKGRGKPEPLKADLRGFWSRRIIGEHRIVYVIDGKGAAQCVIVAQCRYHY